MVTLWEVDGVEFNGCSFRYDDEYAPAFSRKGVYSLDAGYVVGGLCNSSGIPCPINDLQKSEFENLTTGLVATGSVGYYPVWVTNSVFTNCVTGMILDECDDARVVKNDFESSTNTSQVGLYINSSSGFTVEQNKFVTSSAGYYAGVVVKDAGADLNEIYENEFWGCTKGIVSEGANFNPQTSTISKGLKFVCNKFFNSDYFDIHIDGGNGSAIHQGDLFNGNTVSAANQFTPSEGSWPRHYWNESALVSQVNYCHFTGLEAPVNTLNLINVTAGSNQCPEKKNLELVAVQTAENVQTIKSLYIAQNEDYLDAVYTYYSLIDGGNSDELIAAVQSSFSAQAMAVRDSLLAASPLSEVSMVATIQTEVLSNSLLYDVLNANLALIRSNDVLLALENQSNSMPSWMITALAQQSLSPQLKDTLERTMAYFDRSRKDYHSAVIDYYQRCDTGAAWDSLHSWLTQTADDYFGDSRIAENLAAIPYFEPLQTYLAAWPQVNYAEQEFQTARAALIPYMESYLEYFWEYAPQIQKIWPSDTSFWNYAATLSSEQNPYLSARASNLVRFNELADYTYTLNTTMGKRSQTSLFSQYLADSQKAPMINDSSQSLVVYPNPSTGRFWIQLRELPASGATYVVTDTEGRPVASGPLVGVFTEVSLNPSVGNGTFTVTVEAERRASVTVLLSN